MKPICYICKYGEYNPEQPRISKYAKVMEKAGYKVKWFCGDGNRLIWALNVGCYLRMFLKKDDIVLGYVHAGGLAAYIGTLGKYNQFIYDFPDPHSAWYYYWNEKDNLKYKIMRWLWKKVERRIYGAADLVTTASYTQTQFLYDQHGKRNDVMEIFNCPNTNLFKPIKVKKDIDVIFTGKYCEEYGSEIMEELLYACPDVKFKIVKSGTVKHKDMPKLLSRAKIGIVPFKDYFYNNMGSPNKLFEYMACGCVPICSDMIEFRRYITPFKNGLLVNADTISFRDAIASTLRNPKLQRKIAKANLKLIKEQYNWQMQEAKLIDFIIHNFSAFQRGRMGFGMAVDLGYV